MSVDFLTRELKLRYGKFAGEPSEAQLMRYFHLDEADIAFISQRRGDTNRLGVALQLASVRFLGAFVSDLSRIPASVKRFVGAQLSIKNISILANYSKRKTTKREHTALIRKHYGYHDFNKPPWSFRLGRLLYSKAWVSNERPSIMFDFATAWLAQNKVLLPGVSTLIRLITEIRERAINRLYNRLCAIPTTQQKTRLETLLQIIEGMRISRFDKLRKGPTTVSGPAFNAAVSRYVELRAFGLKEHDFYNIPPARLKSVARYAGVTPMHKIARMSDEKRIGVLVAFVKVYETIALDDAIDILDLLLSDIAAKAKRVGQKKRLRSLADLDNSATILADVCALILKEKISNEKLRQTIFASITAEKLEENIATVKELTRPSDYDFHEEMIEQYGRVRQFLPKLLQEIVFKASPAGSNVLEAYNYLARATLTSKQFFDSPPIEIVNKPWKRIVFDNEKRVTKRGYTLCFLEKLQDALRRRDVYMQNSERWGDPRAKLLCGEDWKMNRAQVYRSLGYPTKPHEAITILSTQLDDTYKQVAANFDTTKVRIENAGKQPTLTIINLEKLEEPTGLSVIRERVTELLPKVDLTELLLEIHAHTGFAHEFSHVSEANARVNDLPVSICAVLLAEACNIGLEPLIKNNIPALTRHRLSWVKQNYIRTETLIQANARLVGYQATLSLAKKWGGGEVASADGMRFVTPIKTINAGPNRKYFGTNKGLTWYNFVSDQYSGFHGIVIPGTLRDSIFVLEGLLEQQTGLKPTEIMTDTAGTSYLVFGLFWLLGYQFSPRLADAGEAVFWRINKASNYGVLNDLARGCVNTTRIEQHWDDMMRIAGSLKMGKVRASELIRSLLKSERPSGLTQAIIDAGRINKTLYLLNYIDNEDYRRRILTQLNRGEGRHSVARAICYGQRGEIRKKYKEGQEDQLGALGLVTNAVVLWNTIYMQAALDHLQQSFEIEEDYKARLSPLMYSHINVLGHYSFSLSEQIKKGGLRPLNQVQRNIF